MSDIFRIYMNSKKDDINLRALCMKIYEFIKNHLNRILNLMKIFLAPRNANMESFQLYLITNDTSHYDKITAIYEKYGIKRYEDYARFLSLTQSGGKGNKKTIIHRIKHRKTISPIIKTNGKTKNPKKTMKLITKYK